MNEALINPFWNYSLQLYADKDIRQLCITLQDCYEANVNIILWCCWYASEGGELYDLLLQQVLANNTTWHTHVTRQLRHARQWLNDKEQQEQIHSFRQQILQLEIISEAFQQQQLYELSLNQEKTAINQVDTARTNLKQYFNTLTIGLSKEHWHLIELHLLTRVI